MFPQSDALKFSSGAVCGQAIMAAIDTVASLSVGTTGRITKGTVYQHTHFLRPAVNDDYHVRAEVLRFGKASAFTETRVSFCVYGKSWLRTPAWNSPSDRVRGTRGLTSHTADISH